MSYGVIFFGNNFLLSREIIASDNNFSLKDKIYSKSKWASNFHFPPCVVVEQVNEKTFHLKSEIGHLKLQFECIENLQMELVETYVTTGGGIKIFSPTIILCGGDDNERKIYEYSLEFAFVV